MNGACAIERAQNGMVLRWNGATWTSAEPVAAHGILDLDAVAAISNTKAVAVGVRLSDVGFERVRFVESGSQWAST